MLQVYFQKSFRCLPKIWQVYRASIRKVWSLRLANILTLYPLATRLGDFWKILVTIFPTLIAQMYVWAVLKTTIFMYKLLWLLFGLFFHRLVTLFLIGQFTFNHFIRNTLFHRPDSNRTRAVAVEALPSRPLGQHFFFFNGPFPASFSLFFVFSIHSW